MRIRARIEELGFPRQFWLLFWGMLLNTTGTSMVWPFMTIYLREHLGVPLTTVTLLMTLNSVAGLASVALVGPVVDRVGRKGAMVAGLAAGSAVMAAMSVAGTLPLWAFLMAVQGAVMPLYRVGADAMVADLIPADRRPNAYALLRMATNLGIAIGPSVGGFVAARSYSLAFFIGAAAMATFALLILLLARETMPGKRKISSWGDSPSPQSRRAAAPGAALNGGPRSTIQRSPPSGEGAEPSIQDRQARTPVPPVPHLSGGPVSGGENRGYRPVLRDRLFISFAGLLTLATIPAAMVMVLLPVYAKEQFGVPENQYGFIMATNAAMVVLFQYAVTRVSKRYRPVSVLTVGALLYAVGAGSVALGGSFPAFWISMVVLTLGELLLVPTATALTASLAPADMRGRYMGVYNLVWGVSYGTGPVIGGLLSDRIAPVATWIGGLAIGLAAAAGFASMRRKVKETSDLSEAQACKG